jgi:hypothetical protein
MSKTERFTVVLRESENNIVVVELKGLGKFGDMEYNFGTKTSPDSVLFTVGVK